VFRSRLIRIVRRYKERVLQDSSLREVDWERVLRAVKEDDLFTASDLLTADKELEKALLVRLLS